MPTRLLDWSGSALSALWFAVRKPAAEKPCKNRSCESEEGCGVWPGAGWMLPVTHGDLISSEESKDPRAGGAGFPCSKRVEQLHGRSNEPICIKDSELVHGRLPVMRGASPIRGDVA